MQIQFNTDKNVTGSEELIGLVNFFNSSYQLSKHP